MEAEYEDDILIEVRRRRKGVAGPEAVQKMRITGEMLDDLVDADKFLMKKIERAREKCAELWKQRGG